MNDTITKLLAVNNWEIMESLHENAWNKTSYIIRQYVKSYPVQFAGENYQVPVVVNFYGADKDDYPKSATFTFGMKGECKPNYSHRATRLVGRDRVICCLEIAGQLTALKYVIYSRRVKYFKKSAKQILYALNPLPIQEAKTPATK